MTSRPGARCWHAVGRAARVAAVGLAALVGAGTLGGCASDGAKAVERFHTLLPAAGAASGDRPGGAADPVPVSAPGDATATAARPPAALRSVAVDVLPVSVPAQVDHAQWVVRQPDGSLRLLEQDRWAAALPDELRAALVDGLASRWGGIDVRAVGAPGAAVWRVRVDVQRFESVPGREARLEAAWSLSLPAAAAPPREARGLVCRSVLVEPVGAASVAALAAGHRGNVAKLADAIGERLQALAAGRPAGC